MLHPAGIANIAIYNAKVAYATVDINPDLRAGLYVQGNLTLYGLKSYVQFSMDSNGVQLATSLDFSAVCLLLTLYTGVLGSSA